jgi:hypothetical protein
MSTGSSSILKFVIICDVTFYSTLKMEAGVPSLSLVGTYNVTRRHIPEENNLIVT